MITINIFSILLAVLFTWHYSLRCGYISDDHAAVARRVDIIPDTEKVDRGESFWVKRFNDGLLMYYQTRFFWLLGFKDIPFFWHALSLVLHLVNTYLLYLFLGQYFGYNLAMYACAFWAVNPMINQNVVWISARPYAMALFLVLVACLSYTQPWVFIPFYLLAVITNISIFFMPVILYFMYPEAWQTKLYIISMVCLASPFIIWKFNMRFTKGLVIDRENFHIKWRKINTFARVAGYYIYTLFFPTKMGWYHQAGFRYNEKWEKLNYLTLISYLIIGAMMFYSKLPALWFLLGLFPLSNVLATNSFVQDRYTYFPSIGIALMVAPFLMKYPDLFFCVMTFYITRSYMYSRHMKNDESMYRENFRNHPKSDYAINNLSYFLIQQQRYDEARVFIEQGLGINRMNKMLWYNLGITWAATGHFNSDEGKFRFLRALECWKMALQIEPRWKKPANDLNKLVKILVQKGVMKLSNEEEGGQQITLPNIGGMKESLGNENPSNG